MILPKTLKIGGHTIAVIEVTEPLDSDADGQWLASDNAIKLKSKLPPTQKQATLIHEILHAINIDIPELEVEFISQALFQVLSDNKLKFDGK